MACSALALACDLVRQWIKVNVFAKQAELNLISDLVRTIGKQTETIRSVAESASNTLSIDVEMSPHRAEQTWLVRWKGVSMKTQVSLVAALAIAAGLAGGRASSAPTPVANIGGRAQSVTAQSDPNVIVDLKAYQDMRWRTAGPHRGGRSTAVAGVRTQPNVFYMGASGGGVWKTENFGMTWFPATDGQIATSSIGANDAADSNPRVVFVATGREAIRPDLLLRPGVSKPTHAEKTWHFAGDEGF